jgi:hypothetical protein
VSPEDEERIEALLDAFGEAYREYYEYACRETFDALEYARLDLMAEMSK